MACHLSDKAYTGEVCHVPSCAMLRATFCQRKEAFRGVFCAILGQKTWGEEGVA